MEAILIETLFNTERKERKLKYLTKWCTTYVRTNINQKKSNLIYLHLLNKDKFLYRICVHMKIKHPNSKMRVSTHTHTHTNRSIKVSLEFIISLKQSDQNIMYWTVNIGLIKILILDFGHKLRLKSALKLLKTVSKVTTKEL